MKWFRIIESEEEVKFIDLDEVCSAYLHHNKLILVFKVGSDWSALQITNEVYVNALFQYFNKRSIGIEELGVPSV
jgi:hypothetical protein